MPTKKDKCLFYIYLIIMFRTKNYERVLKRLLRYAVLLILVNFALRFSLSTPLIFIGSE